MKCKQRDEISHVIDTAGLYPILTKTWSLGDRLAIVFREIDTEPTIYVDKGMPWEPEGHTYSLSELNPYTHSNGRINSQNKEDIKEELVQKLTAIVNGQVPWVAPKWLRDQAKQTVHVINSMPVPWSPEMQMG